MRNAILITGCILLMNTFYSLAQHQADSITIKKTLGTVFIQNGKKLKPNQLLEITAINAEAYQEMKIAKTNYTIGSIFGFAGGFLVGWPLGTAIAGGEPNWTLAGIGAGLVVASIPFSVSYTKHARQAVEIYNRGLSQAGRNRGDIKMSMSATGIRFYIMI